MMLYKKQDVASPQRRVTQGKHVLLALLSAMAFSSAAHAGLSIPGDAQPTCVTPSAPNNFATWFESGTVTANGVVKPANGITFPNQPNCSFYQWSEQMFLWLTSPAPTTYGGGGGRVFDSPVFYDISNMDATTGQRTFLPHTSGVFRKFAVRTPQVRNHFLPPREPGGNPRLRDRNGNIFEIIPAKVAPSGKHLINDTRGKAIEVGSLSIKNNKAVFLNETGKVIPFKLTPRVKVITRPGMKKPLPIAHQFLLPNRFPIFLDDTGQVIATEEVQATGDTLMAQNNSLVYYVMEVNDVFAYLVTGTKDLTISPPPTHFPTTQADLNSITTFASAHGKTFPDAEALAVELKTSWIELTPGLDASKYITMKAAIPTYDTTNPDHWVPNGQKVTTLAMVGMHVVGSTNGHPELIWATFEHVDNTPNATYNYNSTSVPNKLVPQDTSGTWLFSASNATGPFNDSKIQYAFPDIVAKNPPIHIGPSDTLRTKPWGMFGNNASSNTEIISMNNSVMNQLAAGDVRKNYVLIGATWTAGGGNSFEVGTKRLSNSTMETYSQGIPGADTNNNGTPNNKPNCFNSSCHDQADTNNLNGFLSHIFGDLKPLF